MSAWVSISLISLVSDHLSVSYLEKSGWVFTFFEISMSRILLNTLHAPFSLSCCLRVCLDLVTNISVCIQLNVLLCLHPKTHHLCSMLLYFTSTKPRVFMTRCNIPNCLHACLVSLDTLVR